MMIISFQAEVELQAPLQAFKALLRYVYSGKYKFYIILVALKGIFF